MSTITIPRRLAARGDLVVIPRKDYEMLLKISRKPQLSILQKELMGALAEVKNNKIYGPFFSVKAMMKSLRR